MQTSPQPQGRLADRTRVERDLYLRLLELSEARCSREVLADALDLVLEVTAGAHGYVAVEDSHGARLQVARALGSEAVAAIERTGTRLVTV